MKLLKLPILLLSAGLASCGVPQADYDAALAENTRLAALVDEYENGEVRLVALAEKAFEEENLLALERNILALEEKHPQSVNIEKLKSSALVLRVKKEERAAFVEASRMKEQAEANRNKTGIWSVSSYVDDFGEDTGEKLIRNRDFIKGVFSNTATENSKLNVRLLIDGPNEVDIMLYQYARTNPVKAYRPEKYVVQIQDKAGSRERLSATNSGDRLSFGPSHSKKFFDALSLGGTVKVSIYEAENPVNSYRFDIENADYFDNAARMIAKK